MSDLRRAGRGRLDDGRWISWSVAEGARGRRWRWTVSGADGALIRAGLVELDRTRGLTRLELATGDGILTFHPSDDGSAAHGNVVRADRVDPISVAWSRASKVGILTDPFACALLGWTGVGVVVAAGLHMGHRRPDEEIVALALDTRGVPQLLDSAEWPLEV